MPKTFDPVLSPASPDALAISHLFTILFIICGVIFALVTGLVIYSIIRYRRRPQDGEPAQVMGNTKLEIVWTAIPLMLLGWVFFLTIRVMMASDPSPRLKPDLVVIGHQWWWEVHYPNSGVVTANEIHIPTGKRLLTRVLSADVIHSFWVPELARKMDMIPGHPNHLYVEADQPGAYYGTCSEYCGAQHAWMRLTVIAEPPAQFAAWEQHQLHAAPAPATTPAARGLHTFQSMTCINCHSIAGVNGFQKVAPDLTHLATRTIIGSGVMKNTPANLALWLKNPQAIKPGCNMPNLQLTDPQVQDLVAYLETLK